MIRRLLNRIKILISPPKTGDTYYGNPVRFVTARPIEYVLHGLKDKYGTSIFEPIVSSNCYRLTIESDVMPTYYKCTAEVFCKSANPLYVVANVHGQWMKRSQPRRIIKGLFKELLLDGILVKN